MTAILEAAGHPEELGLLGWIAMLFVCLWLARREGRTPPSSIRLGPPRLVPLAADQATVAAQLLATTLTPFLSGDDPEAQA